MNTKLSSIKILGTSITTASKDDILEYIFKRLENRSDKFYIVTPNPEILVFASTSRTYQQVLNAAQVSLPDGIGVLMAGKVQKKELKTRITGIDFMLELCNEASKRALTIGLLGGRDGVAETTSECLIKKYPGLRVVFTGEDFPIGFVSHIDILFVAFGAPMQEEWIATNLPNIKVSCAMGVGGAFDYISGKVQRAPKIVRSVGMEWAYRLVRQPWRIKRQFALPLFVGKVLKERIYPSKRS